MNTRRRAALLVISVLSALLLVAPFRLLAEPSTPVSSSTPTPEPNSEIQQLRDRLRRGEVLPLAASAAATPAAPLAGVQGGPNYKTWSRLVWQTTRDKQWEVYIANGDGSDQRKLTFNDADDTSARLNRGATQVVYTSRRDGNWEVYTHAVGDWQDRRLTDTAADEGDPAWSPDSRRIVFASERDGHAQIYVMNADGSGQTRLVTGDLSDAGPAWSPDGSKIAFVRHAGLYGQVWLVNPDGSNPHPISNPLLLLQNVVWTPDGTRLGLSYDADGDQFLEMATMNANGSNLQVFCNLPADPWPRDAWLGAFSPDGQQAVFTEIWYWYDSNYLQWRPLTVWVSIGTVAEGNANRFIDSGTLDMAPDWQGMDYVAPVSSMTALPNLQRAQPFTVRWSAADTGGSGVLNYDVQYRDGSGAWTDWQMATTATSASFTGQAGHTYGFRVRARDYATNVEPWDSKADTTTTLYTYQVTGRVLDAHGLPVPNATLSVAPAPLTPVTSGPDGRFAGYLTGSGALTFTAVHAGYADAQPQSVTVNADLSLPDMILLPTDNVLRDGGLESGALPGDWVSQGSVPASITNLWRHSGANAAQLGQPPALTLAVGGHGLSSLIGVDAQHTVHLVTLARAAAGDGDPDHPYRILYASKPLTGTWPLSQTTILSLDREPNELDMAVDADGGLHLVWAAGQPVRDVYYATKPAGSPACNAPERVTELPAGSPYACHTRVAVDANKDVHVVWFRALNNGYQSAGISYVRRRAGGAWDGILAVPASEGGMNPELALDGTGLVHLTWNKMGVSSEYVVYCGLAPYAYWTPLETLQQSNNWLGPVIAVSADGTVSIMFAGGWYLSKPHGGSWSAAQKLISPTDAFVYPYDIAVDGSGKVHAAFGTGPGGGNRGVAVVQGMPGGAWQRLGRADPVDPATLSLAVDSSGLDLIACDSSVIEEGVPPPVTCIQSWPEMQDGVSVIEQRVTIPANAHRPALSFYYNLPGGLPAGSALRVGVQDGTGDTEAAAITVPATGWTQTWADLTPWAGRSVTVTIGLSLPMGSFGIVGYLDDFSLGSWLTPQPQTVTPAYIGLSATTITIHGDNFVGTPAVWLDKTQLAGVTRVDEHTLLVPVPAGLHLGNHVLRVVNPGGQESTLPAGLQVGQPRYLPLARR